MSWRKLYLEQGLLYESDLITCLPAVLDAAIVATFGHCFKQLRRWFSHKALLEKGKKKNRRGNTLKSFCAWSRGYRFRMTQCTAFPRFLLFFIHKYPFICRYCPLCASAFLSSFLRLHSLALAGAKCDNLPNARLPDLLSTPILQTIFENWNENKGRRYYGLINDERNGVRIRAMQAIQVRIVVAIVFRSRCLNIRYRFSVQRIHAFWRRLR